MQIFVKISQNFSDFDRNDSKIAIFQRNVKNTVAILAQVALSSLPPVGLHVRLLRSPEEQEARCDAEGRGAEAQGRSCSSYCDSKRRCG